MTEEKRIIETIDENGKTIKFELFDIIEFEEKEYALLTDAEKAEDSEEDELVVMRLIQDDEGYTFETIEDDEEFEKVSEYLENLSEEDEEEE